MKLKFKKDKKLPAPVVFEQARDSTIELIKDNINIYGIPKKVFFDNYKSIKSKIN